MANRYKNMPDLDDVVCIANIDCYWKQELGTHNLANMHSLIGCRHKTSHNIQNLLAKREWIRERNRQAAPRCRAKLKKRHEALQRAMRRAQEQNEILKGTLGGLRKEIVGLRVKAAWRTKCRGSGVAMKYGFNEVGRRAWGE